MFRNMDLKWTSKLSSAFRGPYVVSSKSASQIGQSIRSSARALIMDVSEKDRQEGLAWRKRAPELLAEAWDEALQFASQLPECVKGDPRSFKSTQGLLTAMLSLQPGDPYDLNRMYYLDGHDKLSVCGMYRPDLVGVWGAVLATSTGVMVDVKNQRGDYLTNENIHQVKRFVACACSCWQKLTASRSHPIVMVTPYSHCSFFCTSGLRVCCGAI